MRNITCSNPVCGKSFRFDEEKFPDAIKVQCAYCKTIQALPTNPDIWIEPAPPVTPTPVPPAPDSREEDFPPPVNPIAPPAVDSTKKSKTGLIIALAGLVVIGVLFVVFFLQERTPSPPPDRLIVVAPAPMPDYKLQVIPQNGTVLAGESFTLNIKTLPVIDSGSVINIMINGYKIAVNEKGEATFDTIFNSAGEKILKAKMEVTRSIDDSVKFDSVKVSIRVNQTNTTNTTNTPNSSFNIDILKEARNARWFAKKPGNNTTIPLEFTNNLNNLSEEGRKNGSIGNAQNAKLETGQRSNGLEIIPGEGKNNNHKNWSVTGKFTISSLPPNPNAKLVFKAQLGFREWDSMNSPASTPDIRYELRAYFGENDKNGSFLNPTIGNGKKLYDNNLQSICVPIPIKATDGQRITKIAITVSAGNNRGNDRLILIRPRITTQGCN